MENEQVRYQFLHSTTYSDKITECVVAVIKNLNNNTVKLEFIKNPKRKVFISHPALRQKQNRKELYVEARDVDEYTVTNHRLRQELSDLLYGTSFNGYVPLRNLINSPYVFGADINIEVLMKHHYYNLYKALSEKYRMGGLDIETNVVNEYQYSSQAPRDEIIIMTYCSAELNMFIGVHRKFLENGKVKHTEAEVYSCIIATLDKFRENINEVARKIYDTFRPKVTLRIYDDELSLIRGCGSVIHEDKPEYVGIWNMDFDVPRIAARITALGGDPKEFFCHPDVPKELQVFKYSRDDNPDLQHPSHAWHVTQATGYSWFYDAMCLYSRLRKFDGLEDSYGLDAISTKHLGAGKQSFNEGSHYDMQTGDKVNYCAYAVVDSILPVLLEHKNNDLVQMHTLMTYSDLPSFAQQTVQLKNRFYDYCRQNGKVSSSQMGKVTMECDEDIVNVGGNVLEPGLAWRTGVNRIKELLKAGLKYLKNKLQFLVNDIDVAFCLK